MRLIQSGTAVLLAAAFSMACAAGVDDNPNGTNSGVGTGAQNGAGLGTGSTGNTTGGLGTGSGGTTGGGLGTGTGGAIGTATGGAIGTATGGAIGTATGGGTTGGATGGTTGGTGDTSKCGSTAALATPPAASFWETQDGDKRLDLDPSTAPGGPVDLTVAGAGSDPYIAISYTPWVKTGSRACVDVSAFTGVKFDLETSGTEKIYFKVGVPAADTAYPSVVVSPGANTVLFTNLGTATWGSMAAFDSAKVQKLMWVMDPNVDGDGKKVPIAIGTTLKVSNVSFY